MTNLDYKFIIILLIFLLPGVVALTGSQNSYVDIKHSVRVNGAIESGVLCNITITYPNQSLLVDFKPMTEKTSYFNYTLNPNQTSLKGLYNYCITCRSPSQHNNTECFDLLVNLGGVEPSESRTSAVSLIIIFFVALSILCFVAFLYNQHLVFKWSMFLLAILFLLASLNFLFISVQDEVVNSSIENFLSTFTAISYYLYWFIGMLLGFLWLISLIVTVANNNKIKKEKKYGL